MCTNQSFHNCFLANNIFMCLIIVVFQKRFLRLAECLNNLWAVENQYCGPIQILVLCIFLISTCCNNHGGILHQVLVNFRNYYEFFFYILNHPSIHICFWFFGLHFHTVKKSTFYHSYMFNIFTKNTSIFQIYQWFLWACRCFVSII